MPSSAGQATQWSVPNYTGELYAISAQSGRTPLLTMMGGLMGEKVVTYQNWVFPLSQTWSVDNGAQPSISEAASAATGGFRSFARAQTHNTVQIFQERIQVTYAKQSTPQMISAEASTGQAIGDSVNPAADELNFQINASLAQMAADMEYSFLNGSFQLATSATVAAKTRGLVTACNVNAVDASAATLSKALVDELLAAMADSGAAFRQPVIMANSFQKQKLSDIYGYAPPDRTVGGVNVNTIYTDFCTAGVAFNPFMDPDKLLIADLAVCRPVFCPVPGKGVLFYEDLAREGAADQGHVFAQAGLDYGPEQFHGKITGLAVS
jgi:hypothetical protein